MLVSMSLVHEISRIVYDENDENSFQEQAASEVGAVVLHVGRPRDNTQPQSIRSIQSHQGRVLWTQTRFLQFG